MNVSWKTSVVVEADCLFKGLSCLFAPSSAQPLCLTNTNSDHDPVGIYGGAHETQRLSVLQAPRSDSTTVYIQVLSLAGSYQ